MTRVLATRSLRHFGTILETALRTEDTSTLVALMLPVVSEFTPFRRLQLCTR